MDGRYHRNGWRERATCLALAVIIAHAFSACTQGPRLLEAQVDPAQREEPVIPVPLAKVLAAAADGYRTGDTVWIAASLEFPHPVLGVFTSEDDARGAIVDSVPRYDVFPFATVRDFESPPVFFTLCHDPPTRYRPCMIAREEALPLRAVDSIRVVVYANEVDSIPAVYTTHEVDALFFTTAAVDKFLIPYYTALYGPAYADSLRSMIENYVQTGRFQPEN